MRVSGAYPLQFGLTGENDRYFWVNNYLPLQNYSHGWLRIIEKMIEVEILEMVQEDLLAANNLLSKKDSSLPWSRERFHDRLRKPITSLFGIDYPQANSLLAVALTNDLTYQVTNEKEEDFLYQRSPQENNNLFVLDLWGFYLSPRRGTKPSIVTSVLRIPGNRIEAEQQLYTKSMKPLSPSIKHIPPQILQVERHSSGFLACYDKFHPSMPFLQDPNLLDEHIYPFVGWKPYQKYTDISTDKIASCKTRIGLEQVDFKFKLDNQIVSHNEKGKVKEKDIKVYFGVSSTWNRTSLLDPKSEDFMLTADHKIQIHKVNILHATSPSIPQQLLERFISYSPNPLIYKTKNSCMRGKTHSENAVKDYIQKYST